MSGQYPSGYQSPSGHRGNFSSPMMQQQMNQMGGVPNQMGMMGFNQSNVMSNQQQMQSGGVQGGPDMGMGQNIQQQQQQQPNPNQATGQGQQQQPGPGQAQQQQQQQQQNPQQSPQLGMAGGQAVSSGAQTATGGGAPPGQPNAGPVANTQGASNVQQKEFNLLTLCRIGQETVQDIVSRFQEVFGLLRGIQPPNGTNAGLSSSNDKKAKVQEQFRTIRLLFKRLRLLYDKCNDNCQQGMEYTHVESLIPLKGEPERAEPVHTEEYKKALQENRELIEIVMLKNKQLREIIDKIRLTIWEINTMLSMRRC
ncbi:mediator of RNA polymerase II transcription subunit 30 [Aedes albopictus]|uniref:Mediator of RNA polymerase II transcription subunit 30 n=1 Tax=Aedes albopictus TaxID=7160 RepID=A0ABM1YD73_AEDAL|nr:mediator of RNA polymerase II transcription subunit 30 isoform X2 [Aedes albopictus]XP_029727094.1 mediator of RNA polymerase II transcription subunit 30 isoform X1 [Aedes albopictus]XP_029727095.1 mediator of RNA polymerase II transcription subunit 30 isoform X3 [Aedes albopictus]